MEPTSSRSRTRPQSTVDRSSSLEQGTRVCSRRPPRSAVEHDTIRSEDFDVVATSARVMPPPLPPHLMHPKRADLPPVKRPRDEPVPLRADARRSRADAVNMLRVRGPRAAITPDVGPTLLAVPWTPVNVWDFEYPWLEYKRPPVRLVACLLLISLAWVAYMYRAELLAHWARAWPHSHAVWTENMEEVWTQCQALWAQAWAFFQSIRR